MSLTVAWILFGLVAVTAPIFLREKPPQLDLHLGVITFVLIFARGPEPGQTYLLLAGVALGALLFALTLKNVSGEVRSRMRTELRLLGGLIVALLLSAFVVPDTRAAQMPILAVIVCLGAALLVTGIIRFSVLLTRAWRHKPKSA